MAEGSAELMVGESGIAGLKQLLFQYHFPLADPLSKG
jgi:hypothetical protein